MLYIFHVDTGTMMTFDMNLAMHTVANLHGVIAQECRIPEDKQVLLISGGQSLDPSARVCSYSAGTDSNPIYLFSKTTIEAATPPSPSVHYGSDVDLQEQVEGSLIMPPSYETVVSRTQLSLQFHDIDCEELTACEHLVHDQHIQQQGWAAVVANLEDITCALHQRFDLFKVAYNEYLAARPDYLSLLNSMNDTLQLLAKIPMVEKLIADSDLDNTDLDLLHEAPTQIKTLYDWISAQDSQHSLENMVELCVKATEQFNEGVMTGINTDMDQTLESATNQTMKEVKGLEDRLYGLDQIMNGAKRLVQEQADISQAFVKNQTRVTHLRDASVLPDLCASHKKQLLVLLRNHEKLRDVKKKCRLAKEELSVNLHTRLRWVMFVEKKICDVDGKVMIHHENVKRLRKRLDILRQINDSPPLYARLVVEIVCRKQFSSHFVEWARSISEESVSLYDEETLRRKTIIEDLGKHFLQILFPGLEEFPPKYATTAPEPFDRSLPDVSLCDLDSIRVAAPELSPHLQSQILDTVRIPVVCRTKSDSTKRDPGATGVTVPFVSYCTAPEHDRLRTSNTSENCCCIDGDDEYVNANKTNCVTIPRRSSMETFSTEMRSRGAECEIVDGRLISIMHLKDPLLAESPTDVLKDFTEVSVKDVEKSVANSPPTDTVVVYPSASCRKVMYGEVSQEFTTADFYIDESMPSSMSDAQKVTAGHIYDDRAKLLHEKTQRIEQLEAELLKLNERYGRTQTLLRRIVEITHKLLRDFRGECLEWKSFFNESTGDLQRNFFHSFATINDRVIECDRKCREAHMNDVERLGQEHDENRIMYEEKLCVAEAELSSTSNDLLKTRVDLEEYKTTCVKRERALEVQLYETVKMNETERREIIKRHELELEIEVDKVREELKRLVEHREGVMAELQKRVAEIESSLEQTKRDSEICLEKTVAKCKTEADANATVIRTECMEKMDVELKQKVEELKRVYDDDVTGLSATYTTRLQQEVERLEIEMRSNLEMALRNQKDEFYRTEKETWLHDSELEKEKVVNKVELELKEAYDIEMSLSREKFILEKQILLDRIEEKSCFDSAEIISQTELLAQNVITKEEHEAIVRSLRENFKALKTVAIEEALSHREVVHKREMEELREAVETQQMTNSDVMKMSQTAQKQVMFNEAITKVTLERERDLEEFKEKENELRQKESELVAMQRLTNDELECLRVEHEKVVAENKRLSAHNRTRNLSGLSVHTDDGSDDDSNQASGGVTSPVTLGEAEIPTDSSTASESPQEDRLQELQSMLRLKDDEIGKLQTKVMSISMSASAQAVYQDKVSITSCNIGDVVLLCLDEKHDQYVVFTVGTTLHFLHSDCVDTLSLRPGEGEPRKSWVLAEVVEKEYCQARKPNNRFKVPTGTKFYRVKARPWNKERSRPLPPPESS